MLTSPSTNTIPGPANTITAVAGNVVTYTATGATFPPTTSCSVTGAPSNVIINGANSGQVSTGNNVFGAFTVGTGPSGSGGAGYPLTITCGPDSGTATLIVKPSMTISPSIAFQHTLVTVIVNGFPNDVPAGTGAPFCTITSDVHTQQVVFSSPQPCTITSGTGSASGTFIANPGAANTTYTITMTVQGSFATGTFQMVLGNDNGNPGAIPTAMMSLTHAPKGYGTSGGPSPITITGGGFHLGSARFCTLTATAQPLPLFSVASPPCSIDGNGTLTASFAVSPNPGATSAAYTIKVTDASTPTCTPLPGCNPSAISFTVDPGPSAVGNPSPGAGIAGTYVTSFTYGPPTPNAFGGGTSGADAGACTITSNPSSPVLIVPGSQFCVVDNAGKVLLASFTVAGTAPNLSPGPGYTIQITPSHGDTSAASVGAFQPSPVLTINPTSGSPPIGVSPGTTVTIMGTGFKATDTGACTSMTSSASPLIKAGFSCSTLLGTGQVSAQFVVDSLAKDLGLAGYTITVTASGGDSAAVPFTVTPVIVVSPTSGSGGAFILVSGAGFPAGPSTCPTVVLTSIPGGLVSSSSCTQNADGTLSGSFTVNPASLSGPYTIQVTSGVPSFDSASVLFTKGPVTPTHPTITLNPTSGARGTVVQVTGSGFNVADVCTTTISSSPLGLIGGFTCSSMSNGQLAGSFTVQNVLPGTYFVTYTGSGGDSATASFTVTGPQIVETLTPNSGSVATPVTVTGSGFAIADTCGTVTVVSSPPGLISSFACSSFVGGSLTASFTVAAGSSPGVYIVTANGGGGAGDTAQAIFTVTTSTPTIALSSSAAPPNTIVTIAGSGFNPSDTCSGASIIGSIGGLVTATSCSMSNGHIVAASFTVGGVAKASYTITVTGLTGDFAQAPFTVTAASTSFISILPPSGRSGASISVSGQVANASGTTCSMSGTPVGQASCIITGSTMYTGHTSLSFTGTFAVATGSPGPYLVTVTGGNSSVSGIFTVIGATISLTPPSGAIGITVSLSGSGFSSTDTSCTVTSSSVVTNGVCTINSSTGTATGSFLVNVANVAPGPYLVTVTGSPASDVAQATFTVLSGPKITLSPASSTPGTSVTVIGTGFLAADSSCSISGTGVQTPACSVVPGSGTPVGSFLVSAVAPGSYTITLSGGGGDSAQAILTVTTSAPKLTFTASSNGYPGQTIPFVAAGLLVTDTGCSVTGTSSPDGSTIIGSSQCSLSAGTATGTFVVDSLATDEGVGFYTVTVTGNPGADMVAASFTVIPNIVLTPVNGVSGTPVALSGSGFRSGTFTCMTPTSAPGVLFAASPAPTCHYLLNVLPSNGQVAGTFTVDSAAPAGTYVVTVTDGIGAASATFTVGSPVAQVTISPNAIAPPTSGTVSVGITGFGFNGGNNGCIITTGTGHITGTCSFSGGTAGGTLTIDSTTPAGLYLITVKGTPNLDFASNYLAVTGVTTVTSIIFTTSQSTSSTATSTTTTTTQTQTSFSLATTTTTGVLTQVFTQGTLTTISGQTTATFTSITTATVSGTTTTATQTVTSTHTFGMAVQPMNAGSPAYMDGFGLLAMLLVLIPMLVRRLVA